MTMRRWQWWRRYHNFRRFHLYTVSFFFNFYNVSILFATLPIFTLHIIWVPIISPYLCAHEFMYIYFLIWFFPHFCHAFLSLSRYVLGLFFFSISSFFHLFCLCIVNLIMIFYTSVYRIHSHQFKPISDYCTGHRAVYHSKLRSEIKTRKKIEFYNANIREMWMQLKHREKESPSRHHTRTLTLLVCRSQMHTQTHSLYNK